MKRLAIFFGLFVLLINGCSPANVTYLKNADRVSEAQLKGAAFVYEAKIMPKDELTISIHTEIPEAAAPFNLGSNAGSGVNIQGSTGATLQTYIVDNNGDIEYPLIGKLHLQGMTRVEAQDLIKSKIFPQYITKVPMVNVRFKNYKISVLGEVARPGTYVLSNEQCTIFDALAQAGDLTVYGKRENVLLVRELADGTKQLKRINLQDARLLLDPNVYYLQQNDVLYVEPNKTKAKTGNLGASDSYTVSIISTLIAVATLVVSILR
jgi:polysaccharide export outer membrane protein